MIIDDNVLKYDGQWPKLIHALVISTVFFKYLMFLTIALTSFHEILSELGVNKLLHLLMALINSSFKKEGQ